MLEDYYGPECYRRDKADNKEAIDYVFWQDMRPSRRVKSATVHYFIPISIILFFISLILSLIAAARSKSSFLAASFISPSSLLSVSSSYPYSAFPSAATGTVQ